MRRLLSRERRSGRAPRTSAGRRAEVIYRRRRRARTHSRQRRTARGEDGFAQPQRYEQHAEATEDDPAAPPPHRGILDVTADCRGASSASRTVPRISSSSSHDRRNPRVSFGQMDTRPKFRDDRTVGVRWAASTSTIIRPRDNPRSQATVGLLPRSDTATTTLATDARRRSIPTPAPRRRARLPRVVPASRLGLSAGVDISTARGPVGHLAVVPNDVRQP
jgi:hypothetical protein